MCSRCKYPPNWYFHWVSQSKLTFTFITFQVLPLPPCSLTHHLAVHGRNLASILPLPTSCHHPPHSHPIHHQETPVPPGQHISNQCPISNISATSYSMAPCSLCWTTKTTAPLTSNWSLYIHSGRRLSMKHRYDQIYNWMKTLQWLLLLAWKIPNI